MASSRVLPSVSVGIDEAELDLGRPHGREDLLAARQRRQPGGHPRQAGGDGAGEGAIGEQEAHDRRTVDRLAGAAVVHLPRRERAQHAHPLHLGVLAVAVRRAGRRHERGRPDAEHPGRHVGPLERLAEAQELVGVVAAHRRREDAVEPLARRRRPGRGTGPGCGGRRRRGGATRTNRYRSLTTSHTVAGQDLARRAQVLPRLGHARRRRCRGCPRRRRGTARSTPRRSVSCSASKASRLPVIASSGSHEVDTDVGRSTIASV